MRLSISVKVFGVWGGSKDSISHGGGVVDLLLSCSIRDGVINSTLSKRFLVMLHFAVIAIFFYLWILCNLVSRKWVLL